MNTNVIIQELNELSDELQKMAKEKVEKSLAATKLPERTCFMAEASALSKAANLLLTRAVKISELENRSLKMWLDRARKEAEKEG